MRHLNWETTPTASKPTPLPPRSQLQPHASCCSPLPTAKASVCQAKPPGTAKHPRASEMPKKKSVLV